MTKIGIIGTGHMGGMFIRKFTETGAVRTGDITAYNRSAEKLRLLAEHTGIGIGKDNRDVAERSGVIFLCVKPLDVKSVIGEVKGQLTPGKVLISVASSITIADLAALCNARIARVIPSVTSECLKGVSLVSFGPGITAEDRVLILSLLGHIGKPVVVKEKDLELLIDLTSCAPAFIAAMMREFALAAVRKDGVAPELAELLVKETLAGTAELLAVEGSSFEAIVEEVATKGGITEEGVKVIDREIPAMYDHLLEATRAKRKLVFEKIKDQK